MTRALLVPFAQPGHTAPMAELGWALRRRGHQVTALVPDRLAGPFHRYGITTGAPRRGPHDPVPVTGDAAATARHLMLGPIVDMTVEVADVLTDTGADVVVSDVFAPAGGLAAERTGRPWATLACSPVPAADSYRVFVDPALLPFLDAAPVRAALDLPAREENLLGALSPDLHLIPTTRRFAGDAALPAQTRLVGPLVPEPGPEPDVTGPTVVVTVTSNDWARLGEGARRERRTLRTAVRAFADTDLTTVVITPTGAAPDGTPAAVQVTGPLPGDAFDALLDRCAAVVTHGGWGTVGRALLRGLPVVVLPTGIDQPYVADRCAQTGLGVALDALTTSPRLLHDAVREVRTNPAYWRAARRFAAEARAAGGALAAADLIAGLERTSCHGR